MTIRLRSAAAIPRLLQRSLLALLVCPPAFVAASAGAQSPIPPAPRQQQGQRDFLAPAPGEISQQSGDAKTLIIGTRLVRPSQKDISPSDSFYRERVPASELSEADKCVEDNALDVAREYFETLGRTLEAYGYYHTIPDHETQRIRDACERQHAIPAKALRVKGTVVMAFARIVSIPDAPILERKLQ